MFKWNGWIASRCAERSRELREGGGGVHGGPALHQQDEVGGEEPRAALRHAGDVARRRQAQARGRHRRAVQLQAAHPTGEGRDRLSLTVDVHGYVELLETSFAVLQ